MLSIGYVFSPLGVISIIFDGLGTWLNGSKKNINFVIYSKKKWFDDCVVNIERSCPYLYL